MSQTADREAEVRDPMSEAERREHFAPSRSAFESLLKSQHASPERLAGLQQGNARQLVAHALELAPYYRERLRILCDGAGGIDLARWLEVPVLKRADLAAEAEGLTAASVPPGHGGIRIARTSGTTGSRIEVLRSELQDSVNACSQFRFWHDCGFDFAKNLGVIRGAGPSAGPAGELNPEETKWGPPWLPFRARGNRGHIPAITPPARQLDWLGEHTPVYLHTMPSNLLTLAHHVRDHGGAVAGIAGAITGGEVLTADIRTQVRRWLGLNIFDSLASAECGLIATHCPDGGVGYHIEAEVAAVEVLKEDGTPCRPGETGLLTVTPFYGFAMPLIRYQSDDWVTVGETCSCGRTLPVIAEIVGRDHTLLRFSDGPRRRLELDSDEVFRHLGPRRWQVVQTASDRLEIRVAEQHIERPADFEAMSAYVRRKVGRDIQIECVFVAALDAAPNGKFDRVIREFERKRQENR